MADPVSQSLSRRKLLRALGLTSAAAVVAPLVAACGGAPASPTSAPAAPTKPAAAPAGTSAAGAATTPAAGATTTPAAAATKPAAETKPAASGQRVEVTFLTTQTGPADVKIYEELSQTFTAKNPSITVKINAEAAGTSYDQKLLTYLAANTLPDIVQTNDNFAAPFKKAGITRDMIPLATASGFPYKDFDPTFLELGMVDNELHMLPKQGDVIVPYVNLRMMKEAGLELPIKFNPTTEPDAWTWDDFLKAAAHMSVDSAGKRGDEPGFNKDDVAVYGASIALDAWYTYVPMVLAEGGQFVSEDLTKSMIKSPEGVAAFTKLTDPVKAGWFAPPTLIQTMTNSGNVFAAGKAAMAPLQRLWCTTLRSQLQDDFDVMHFPKGKTKRVTGMGTFGFALTAKSKNPDQAWKFLEYMYSEDGMKLITQSYAAVPAMKRFYDSPFWRELPGPPYNNAVFVDAFAYGTTPPRLPFYSTGSFRQAVTDGILGIVLGQTTPEQVVGNIDSALTTILNERKQ